MREALLISKPIVPPWTDSNKNLVRDLARALQRYRGRVLVPAGSPLDGVESEPLYAHAGTYAPALSANARVMARLLVGPRFHRLHHALAGPDERHIHDHNFAPVFPIWDILFGTAIFDRKNRPTGVDDPDIDSDNERGWLGQQVAGVGRLLRALAPRFRRARAL